MTMQLECNQSHHPLATHAVCAQVTSLGHGRRRQDNAEFERYYCKVFENEVYWVIL